MTTERIDIIVQERGSRVVKRNLADIGSSADRTGKSVDYASKAIAALGAALAVQKLIDYSDQLTAVEGRLRLVTNTTEQFNRVQSQLFDLAQRTRNSFTATVDLYAKMAKATEGLALSEGLLLEVTESVNKTLVISGASAQAAQAALVQFGQGLSAGALRGEELNSILEQSPRLAQALADGLGKPVGALKALGEAGELTSERIVAALQNQREKIDREFSQLAPTIGQAFTQLNNELLLFVGQGAKTSGAAGAIASAIGVLARNLDTLSAAALGFAATKVAQVLATIAAETFTAIRAAQAYIVTQQAERAAAIASAQAEAAKTAATVRDTQAKLAQITATRAVTVAELQLTNASIAAAQAQIAASRAAGAQSFALASLRSAEQALTAAMATRAALTTELAALGVAQARASAAATAATTAQTAATAGLAAASGTASVASRALVSVLGFLGGPIGAITTVLGLGVTAWLLWGSTSRKEAQQTATETKQSTQDIIAGLDSQIRKLEERNRLAGAFPKIAQGGGAPAERLAELGKQIEDLTKGTGEAAKLTEVARQAVLQVTLKQYGELAGKIQRVGEEQTKLDSIGQTGARDKWLEKYATDAEKLAAELAKAKKELGAAFTPELEARIRESFASKGSQANPFKDQVQSLREKTALLGQTSEVERTTAEIALGNYGRLSAAQKAELISLAAIFDAKQRAISNEQELEAIRARAADISIRNLNAALAEADQLEASNRALREEIELLGADEQMRLTIERIRLNSLITLKEEELLNRLNAEGVSEVSQALERQIALLRQRAELLGQKGTKLQEVDAQDAGKKIGATAQRAETALAESIANGMLEGFRRGESLADIFLRELKAQFAKTVLTPMIQPIVQAGNDLLGGIFGTILKGIFGTPGSLSLTPGAVGTSSSTVGMSLATGTNYVPYDNFPANLHKGEAVVPAEYNPAAGGKGRGGGITLNSAPVYNIDSRTDRAAIRQDMVELNRQSNEELVQNLRDAGLIATG